MVTRPLTKKQLAERAVQREIARRNKIFSAATAAEKRVLVAKDVIAQIKLKRVVPASGVWIDPKRYEPLNLVGDETVAAQSIQRDLLTGELDRCSCCALGAVFVSCTLFNNQTTVKDLDNARFGLGDSVEEDEKLSNGMNRVFSRAQLALIEQAFESGHGQFGLDLGADEDVDSVDLGDDEAVDSVVPAATRKLLLWQKKYPDDKDRLIAIMKNIIENNGTFKP